MNLGQGICIYICTSFHVPDSGLYLLNGFDFYFDLFEWRDTENQQSLTVFKHMKTFKNEQVYHKDHVKV